MPVRKRDKNAEGFQISHFYGSFSSDIKAVKALNSDIQKRKTGKKEEKKDRKKKRQQNRKNLNLFTAMMSLQNDQV